MDFLKKGDFYSKAVFVFIFLTFLFFSKEAFGSGLYSWIGGGVGAIFSYYVVSKLVDKTSRIKRIALAVVFTLFVLIAYVSVTFLSEGMCASYNSYNGTWVSDDSDGIVIRLRFNEENAYLSMSPNFDEVGYLYRIENDSLFLSKDGKFKFRWLIVSSSKESFEIKDASSKVKFMRDSGRE